MRQKLGQHFLKNKKWAELVASQISGFKKIIEVGPGRGALTEKIFSGADQDAKIIAIEKDPRLLPALREKFPAVELIESDILKILPRLMEEQKSEYIIVGNIPYYLTGFLLRKIGESKNRPQKTVFMIQKEVAERICSQKGEMNRLSASIQAWGSPKILANIPRGDFSPPPEVESSVIEIINKENNRLTDLSPVFSAIRVIFSQPRKTLLNNLSTAVNMPKAEILKCVVDFGISANFRPQDLDIEQIFLLTEKFSASFK